MTVKRFCCIGIIILLGCIEERTMQQAIDPGAFIQTIRLDFNDDSNNKYAVSKSSSYNFKLTILDNQDVQVIIKNYKLIIGNKEYSSDVRDILIEETGTLTVLVESYGHTSNTLKIISRENIAYPEQQIPVVFHLINNLNILPSVILREVDLLNKQFANTYQHGKKGLNAVNTGLQFYAATMDPEGNMLEHPGVNIIEGDYPEGLEPQSIQVDSIMFANMWDPDLYMNIMVADFLPKMLTGDDVPSEISYAYFPDINSLPGDSLQFPYGLFMNDLHLGKYITSHEMGHALGLLHSWGRSCGDVDSRIKDVQHYINKPENLDGEFRKGCTEDRFLSTNYMDYNDGNYNTFTYDQRVIMHNTFLRARHFPNGINKPINGRSSGKWRGILDPTVRPVICSFEIDN